MSSRGCPLYMAPELFSNEGAHSYSSDFWALGCIMFELRMNGTPFSCKWHRDQQTTPEDQVSGFYQEEVDGTPQDILENIRKFQLSTIVDMIIARSNRSDKIKRQQRSKSPSKGQYNPNSGAREEFVPTISPELMDLLCWILDRIPSYRCTW